MYIVRRLLSFVFENSQSRYHSYQRVLSSFSCSIWHHFQHSKASTGTKGLFEYFRTNTIINSCISILFAKVSIIYQIFTIKDPVYSSGRTEALHSIFPSFPLLFFFDMN